MNPDLVKEIIEWFALLRDIVFAVSFIGIFCAACYFVFDLIGD